jgi:hypothetical protein
MKTYCCVVLVFLSVALSGCVSPEPSVDYRPRFQESSQTDVVLRFSSWDYTFMSKPVYAENGFMQQVRRDTLDDVLSRLGVERDLAVVVVGWQYQAEPLAQIVAEWKQIFGQCGFRRVVILRPAATSELNGSVIVEDARFPLRNAQTAFR